MVSLEHTAVIKFFTLAKKNPREIKEMIDQVYVTDSLTYAQIKHWANQFKHRRVFIENEEKVGRPISTRSQKQIQAVAQLLEEDKRQSVEQIAHFLNISNST